MAARNLFVGSAALLLLAACGAEDDAAPAGEGAGAERALRLNEIQLVATHNSYHIAPTGPAVADWMYTHEPLDVQVDDLGVRGFELDTHFDAESGELLVHHIPGLDDGTTCDTLRACLQILKSWSDAHPEHHALFVQIEPKDEDVGETPDYVAYADALDDVLSAVWTRKRILAPDDVQGDAPTLREAVMDTGWPSVEATRGKLLVYLDERGPFHDAYTRGGDDVRGRLAFPSSSVDEPIAAVVISNDPTAGATRAAVEQGFVVRTRADSVPVPDAVTAQRKAALASGAQIVTTDFPLEVTLPGGKPSRCNPVTSPRTCTARQVETL